MKESCTDAVCFLQAMDEVFPIHLEFVLHDWFQVQQANRKDEKYIPVSTSHSKGSTKVATLVQSSGSLPPPLCLKVPRAASTSLHAPLPGVCSLHCHLSPLPHFPGKNMSILKPLTPREHKNT